MELQADKIISIEVPKQFSLFCELLQIDAQKFIQGFVYDVSCDTSSIGQNKRDSAFGYFNRCTIDNPHYDSEQLRDMMDELDFLREKMYNFGHTAHQEMKDAFYRHWFLEWRMLRKGDGKGIKNNLINK